MRKLIEFKLWAGNFPYFVDCVIGGIDINGKRYGISKDNKLCYLPDTVKVLTEEEFIDCVKGADVYTQSETDMDSVRYMTEEEKIAFAKKWIQEAN